VQGMTAEQGARASIRLAADEASDEASGTYFNEGVATQPSPAARDAAMRAALWEASLRLAGLS